MVINPIVGVYIPIIRIPFQGWMTIPNIATFDHGTFVDVYLPYSFQMPCEDRCEHRSPFLMAF